MSGVEFKMVEGHDDLVRHSETKAVINIDHGAYSERKRLREIAQARKNKEVNAETKIATLEQQVAELKQMMEILMSQNKN